jgi:hypothetical protein
VEPAARISRHWKRLRRIASAGMSRLERRCLTPAELRERGFELNATAAGTTR